MFTQVPYENLEHHSVNLQNMTNLRYRYTLCIFWGIYSLVPAVNFINPFASTPVAATGFQTQATYYTCHSDGFTVPKRTLLSELIIVHKNIY